MGSPPSEIHRGRQVPHPEDDAGEEEYPGEAKTSNGTRHLAEAGEDQCQAAGGAPESAHPGQLRARGLVCDVHAELGPDRGCHQDSLREDDARAAALVQEARSDLQVHRCPRESQERRPQAWPHPFASRTRCQLSEDAPRSPKGMATRRCLPQTLCR